jgi:PAS domain S-box-containing protein
MRFSPDWGDWEKWKYISQRKLSWQEFAAGLMMLCVPLRETALVNKKKFYALLAGLGMVPAQDTGAPEQIRLMLDSIPMPCSLWDAGGTLLDCNQETLSAFGIAEKSEFLDHFYDLVPECQPNGKQSRSEVMRIAGEVLKTGYQRFEWMYLTRTGAPFPVEATVARIPWEDGWRFVSYARDLRKLVETEDDLKRMLAMMEASPDLALLLREDRTIEYMNPALSIVSGFSREELLGKGLALVFSPEDYQTLDKEYLAVVQENLPIDFEMALVTKNSKKYVFAFSAFTVRQRYGSAGIGILGSDVSDLIQIQRELRTAKEQAERALVQEQQYNRAKNNFVSRISHELRTPINAITGLASIAAGTNEKEALDHCHANIKKASAQLLDLVNNILDMASLDTGKFAFLSKPFSFSYAMRQVIGSIAQKTRAREQVFITDIDGGIHDQLFSDEGRLKQIVLNLLSNAVKFTPEQGKIEFSARMLEYDGNDCLVRFEVRDNGIGISPEMQERLLSEAFEQADDGAARSYDGMGLGLPLTKRMVDLLKGKLRIESAPGEGCRILCDVRLGVALAGPPQEGAHGTAGGTAVDAPMLDLTGRRVLVVDDVDINREVLIALLENTKAIFDEAGNGDEALKLFSQQAYDLVLMDLHMPVMDGFAAAKHIRALALPEAKKIPIIAVSAESGADLPLKCLEAGINDYLVKPVDLERLFKKVATWMSD